MMFSIDTILPGTGRGTVRRMVEGSAPVGEAERVGAPFGPSVSLTAATSPFRGGFSA